MKYYNITQIKESGTYFRNDTVYIKVRITDAEEGTPDDPSEVSIEVIDPCGNDYVSLTAMSKDATGEYYYEFDLDDDIPFGLYDVNVITFTHNQTQKFRIVVFPFDICARTREILSAYQQNDISDYKLALIAWHSYKTVLNEIYDLHWEERPKCNPTDGSWFDGTNKTFQLRSKYIADYNGDGEITGEGEITCGSDISFYYIDNDRLRYNGHVNVVDADNGIVQLLTDTDDAVPNTMQRAYVSYYTRSEYYDETIMHEAVAYLTAYKVAMTYKSLNSATMADIQTNRQLEAKIFKDKYEELIGMIGFNAIGCGK